MSIDILVHKNTYTKIQSALTYGFLQHGDKYKFQIVNCHNSIYDLYYAYKPKNILLQIEEYSNEFHTFANDPSIQINKLFLSIENNKINFDTYIKILQQIRSTNIIAVAPRSFIEYAKAQQMDTKNFVQYDNLVNKYIFFNKSLSRNNKILCIMSTDKDCLTKLDKFVYPKSKMPIVLINNPEINNDQNIGLMLDDDLNTALNTYGSVIDLTESYDGEISVCQIPKYNIDNLDNLDSAEPSTIQVDIEDAGQFITSKLMGNE
jgi:hypothetical protein